MKVSFLWEGGNERELKNFYLRESMNDLGCGGGNRI